MLLHKTVIISFMRKRLSRFWTIAHAVKTEIVRPMLFTLISNEVRLIFTLSAEEV